ncbi:uncharacterized protein LOC120155400 [Hibiscus syriacus]|uniref:uncharacterized protein LOC120155400 n=1 Tax=Hibiscus syriacus TaxID=106335 RepID=UPI00192357D3|nr:uncharacterized protein LOC120155400 [Hibiscus syriacus]
MMKIKTPRSGRVRRALEKRAPKLVETGNKTLILQGAKTSGTLNEVLSEIYPLKKGGAVRFTRKNDNIRPFESRGETSLESFSLKTDCNIFVVSSRNPRASNFASVFFTLISIFNFICTFSITIVINLYCVFLACVMLNPLLNYTITTANRAVTKAGSAAEASVEGDTLAAFSNKLSSPNSSALEKMPSFSIDESPSSSALDNNPAFSTLLRTFLFSSCLNTSLIKVI